ncbi:MAG: histone deacetylase [Gemmatimonadales bacterium]|jgi:acetoin utilization deacetylase AcuC-like enzyme|nr:histone deacetylase [Gemmatimonadales bacterium]MDG2241083.1 histone deacetylase [Longimicrobiales bacterium]MBT3773040.1 histone deacetylase [Gemmatimonadales bacterium]MBT3959319.1 histone deacetylase [Gemmatimonadales bacterium]MBT4437939.1 histone deacetylase [Gemmatimonadales bacterium]
MRAPTGFYLHPSSPLHDTGWAHPEHQGRLRALASTVGKDMLTLHGRVEQQPARDATVEDVLRVHTEAQVEQVRHACEMAEETEQVIAIDPDTKVSSASWEAALGSAGTAIAAAEAVSAGRLANAFVATRPPGHHATPDQAMGFCLFNNVAVTARWLQATGRAERVLILDWDVHHGNGTQDTFYDDPTVFFVSAHQWPHYPGSGAADERGEGPGLGYTLNVPLPAGTSAEAHRAAFEDAVDSVVGAFHPDFILVSAGFDCMAGDPLGDMLLEPTDLFAMTRHIMDHADRACGGRIVALLEGGYDPSRLGIGTLGVIRALAGLEASGI